MPALEMLGELLAQWGVAGCHWLLDEPVSNSGRLKTMLVPGIKVTSVGHRVAVEVRFRPSGASLESMVIPDREIKPVHTTIQIRVAKL